MTREVSRRTSYAPEAKGAVRPDIEGLRGLDERIVEDRPDPVTRGADMDRHFRQMPGAVIDRSQRPRRPRVLKGRVPNG